MGGLVLMCKFISFLQVFPYSFVGNIANIYLTKKNWALLTDLLKVKNNMFCQTIATYKNVDIV